MSIGIPASRNTRSTPMCAMPRANPPAQRHSPARRPLIARRKAVAERTKPFLHAAQHALRACFLLICHTPILIFSCLLPNTCLTRGVPFCNLFCRPNPVLQGLAMTHRIQKAVVLGAGTMGARIAAHFANARLPCLLLDIVPKDATPADRNKVVFAGLDAAKKAKPAAFFTPALASKVSVGNFEDDLPRIADADWIIEVVAENLEIKRGLLAKVAQFRKA